MLVLSVAICGSAHGRTLAAVEIVGDEGGCPSPARVAAVLQPLLPNFVVDLEEKPGAVRAAVSDLGLRYRVTVGDRDREFSDAERNCNERAHAAAVFMALVIEQSAPPFVDEPIAAPTKPPEPARPAPPPEARPPAPQASTRDQGRRMRTQIEVEGRLSAAPRTGASSSLYSGGATFRLIIGGEHLAGWLGVAGLSPTSIALSTGRVELTRVPFYLGVRGALRLGERVELFGGLGAVLGLLVLQGHDLQSVGHDSRFEFAFHLSLGSTFWVHRQVGLFLTVDTEVVPAPTEIIIGAKRAESTPTTWVGTSLGLAFRIR